MYCTMYIGPLFSSIFIRIRRNSVPQSPNFPVANASAHELVLQRVTEMFKHNFPYTTVYPALGNLDVLHPNILQRRQEGSLEEIHHYSARNQRKKSSHRRNHHKDNLGKDDMKSAYLHSTIPEFIHWIMIYFHSKCC